MVLDLLNTLDQRPAEPKELLVSDERAVGFAVQAGILADSDHDALRRKDVAATELRELRELRELLFDIVESIVSGQEIDCRSSTQFVAWVRKAASCREFQFVDNVLTSSYSKGSISQTAWYIVDEAVKLFSDTDLLSRLKFCSAPNCQWAFVDRSRQRNRNWCDMSVCGNRAKIKRYRANDTT